MDRCGSEGEDQHLPGSVEDVSHEATEESEGEEQSTLLAFLLDKHEPAEVPTVLEQESLGVTSTGGYKPSDSQEEVVIHTADEEINSLC